MDSFGKTPGVKPAASSNLYTIILVFSFCIVVATAALVAYKCYSQYDTIFKIW